MILVTLKNLWHYVELAGVWALFGVLTAIDWAAGCLGRLFGGRR